MNVEITTWETKEGVENRPMFDEAKIMSLVLIFGEKTVDRYKTYIIKHKYG